MIKASHINNLLEEWISVRGRKIEVLDNPKTWRESASAFKSELRDLKRSDDVLQILRFFYDENNKNLKVWIGFYAVHVTIINRDPISREEDCWCGWIDLDKKVVEVVYPDMMEREDYTNEYVQSIDELPRYLQKFLSGLRLGKGEEVDSPERF